MSNRLRIKGELAKPLWTVYELPYSLKYLRSDNSCFHCTIASVLSSNFQKSGSLLSRRILLSMYQIRKGDYLGSFSLQLSLERPPNFAPELRIVPPSL